MKKGTARQQAHLNTLVRQILTSLPPPASLVERRRKNLLRDRTRVEQRIAKLYAQAEQAKRMLATLMDQEADNDIVQQGLHTAGAGDELWEQVKAALSRR